MNRRRPLFFPALALGPVVLRFPGRYAARTLKRLFYCYFLRDFNGGTLQIVLAALLLAAGGIFGLWHWHASISTGIPATSGTVMLAALPVLLGGYFAIGALAFDIANVPRRCIHPALE